MVSYHASRPARRIGGILWGIQIVVASVASALVWFRSISIAHCAQDGDFELLSRTSVVFAVVAVGLVVAAAVGLLLARKTRWSWVFPAGGIALTLGAAIIAHHVSDVALRFV
ncbi:hypothetical protein [Microbacterium sp. TNHR37B]|uniref:hypothetical protein n=1 Tax=Microbacterium sp. TNHR37B TaxID=1775956 RepID=UPI0007B2CC72|nr:hypothetical protein [Microbacterium sp. TNHR37B]KZE91923.1 hypothetical protein AVP41_01473 [Microbacterium sp. TNHR37B]